MLRPISMPSVVRAKVVRPMEAAMTQILAPRNASPTPTAAASMLVPTAVAIRAQGPERVGAASGSAGFEASQIILPPTTARRTKAIQ